MKEIKVTKTENDEQKDPEEPKCACAGYEGHCTDLVKEPEPEKPEKPEEEEPKCACAGYEGHCTDLVP
jgi:hypothetical protein